MPRRLDEDLYAPTPGAFHYNVRYLGDVVCTRVTARHFEGVKPDQIDWVWIVEAKRYAAPKEIADLCTGKPLKGSGSV